LNLTEPYRAQLTLTQCPGPNSPAIGLSDQRPAKLGSVWQHLATVSLRSSHNQCFYNFIQFYMCVSQCFTHVDCVDAVTGASSWEQLCNSLAIFLGSLQCSAVQDFLDIPLSLLPPPSAWAASPVALPSDTTVVFVLNTVGPCESCLWIWQCLPQKRVSNDNQGNLNFVLPNFQPCIALPPSRKITLAAVVGPRPHQQLLAGPAQPSQVDRPTWQTGIWSGYPPSRAPDGPGRQYHCYCFLPRMM